MTLVSNAGAPPIGSRQARAVAHVRDVSAGSPLDPALHVALHFHPDRIHEGVPILRALAADGLYRSQFETGTSNGWLDTERGGSRWRWENHVFGGAYDDAAPSERPKYGALNYRRRATGGSPRFGSAFLRLRPAALPRCTFCYPDSSSRPSHFGVADRMSLIAMATQDQCDRLDDHIEAHVHGPVRIEQDVEALVLDPCYQGTEIESLANALPCPAASSGIRAIGFMSTRFVSIQNIEVRSSSSLVCHWHVMATSHPPSSATPRARADTPCKI